MAMRLSGLMSGMDTESIVSQLVEARKAKVTKAVKAQKTIKYKQDAWKDLNKQIVNLYNKSLSNLRFESSFVKKVTKVSNSSVVSVITGENAMNGVQSLKVDRLAQSGFLTGGKLPEKIKVTEDGVEKDVTVTGETTLGQLGLASGTGTLTVKVGNETASITVDEKSTVDNFVKTLRTAGLNANFDAVNGRIYVGSKSSGVSNDFSITAVDAQGFSALGVLRLSYGYGEDWLKNKYGAIVADANDTSDKGMFSRKMDARLKTLNGQWQTYMAGRAENIKGFSQEAIDKVNAELVKSSPTHLKLAKQSDGSVKLIEEQTGASDTLIAWDTVSDDQWNQINNAIQVVQNGLDGTLGESSTATDNEKKAASDLAASLKGWFQNRDNMNTLAQSFAAKIGADGKEIEVGGVKQPILDQLSNDELRVIDDAVGKARTDAQGVLDDLAKFDALNDDKKAEVKASFGQKTAATDAAISLNGVSYTSEKNTFAVNGLTLTVNATTAANETVTITTEDDTDGIYDMVKGFIKEYNALINQMDKLYNADSAKGYEPLTDEEKDAMSDSAVEEWETKIKDAALRKDTTLGMFANEMKLMMMKGVEIEEGKKVYLSNFGIGTLSYFLSAENEKNAYHIDGDPDDASTSGNPDKLKSAIANDPDSVISFFTKMSQQLYDKMFDMMKNVEGVSSSMTAYEDKRMQKEYDDYTTKIKELEKKLADYEDKWYAKFAAMETALSKMQNNASAVTSLLGGS